MKRDSRTGSSRLSAAMPPNSDSSLIRVARVDRPLLAPEAAPRTPPLPVAVMGREDALALA